MITKVSLIGNVFLVLSLVGLGYYTQNQIEAKVKAETSLEVAIKAHKTLREDFLSQVTQLNTLNRQYAKISIQYQEATGKIRDLTSKEGKAYEKSDTFGFAANRATNKLFYDICVATGDPANCKRTQTQRRASTTD